VKCVRDSLSYSYMIIDINTNTNTVILIVIVKISIDIRYAYGIGNGGRWERGEIDLGQPKFFSMSMTTFEIDKLDLI